MNAPVEIPFLCNRTRTNAHSMRRMRAAQWSSTQGMPTQAMDRWTGVAGKTAGRCPGEQPDAHDVDAAAADASSNEIGSELRDGEGVQAEAEAAAVCDPTGLPSVSPCMVDEAFGMFVSPADNDLDAGTSSTACCADANLGAGDSPGQERREACSQETSLW